MFWVVQRLIWFTVFVVTRLVAIIALTISSGVQADEVTNFAISEGCVVAPVLTTIALVATCAIISVATWHSSRHRRPADWRTALLDGQPCDDALGLLSNPSRMRSAIPQRSK